MVVAPAAVTAAIGLGGIGLVVGLVISCDRGSLRALLFCPATFGIAGAFAGFTVAGLLATLLAPVVQVL
ncbi:hypothetical protein D3C83_259610 [compost metagenome]